MNGSRSQPQFDLALETSGKFGAAALGLGNDCVELVPFAVTANHAAQLLPTIDALCRRHGCAPSDLRCVYVSAGPGSFTGLRVGVATARMLALALSVKLVSVPTLEAVAQNAINLKAPPSHVAVLLDAKREHVYACAFQLCGERYVALAPPVEADPAAFLASMPRDSGVLGEGVQAHRNVVEASGLRIPAGASHAPDARIVLQLGREAAIAGRFTEPRTLVPIYVRRAEAEERWEARHAAASASAETPFRPGLSAR
ncbi:MAG: tRNA (adenosine(37)-N6)-threonylcarbamoyltransferase complex dimerization subunit type 1 TsaB [Phycisphaerales bacterium]|nr:tRNA (adenosine(37)-N6)-threonylcarbamoyltransferase complex dimerization subunit type 1 TsaB [Phycisphaerales bacterium]